MPAEADPTQYPSDQQLAQWMEEYGTTGVKTTPVSGRNQGCVAVYREMSMSERQVAARIAEIDEEAPGVYDRMRMLVASCLLHPTVESYPVPYQAVAELFQEIKNSGHSPKGPDEDMIGPDGEPVGPEVAEEQEIPVLPGHMVEDINAARRSVRSTFEDPRFSSIYRNVIIELSQTGDPTEGLDPSTVDYLWRLPVGRLRDLAAVIERANLEIRQEAYQSLGAAENLSEDQKKQRSRQIDLAHQNPWQNVDRITGGAANPDVELGEEDEETEPDSPQDSGEKKVAPNRPQRAGGEEDLEDALREELRRQSANRGPQ
jgi:hypothetical protein